MSIAARSALGQGEYGEGDLFIGVKVPAIRKVAKEFNGLPLSQVECLLHSEIHEERLLALVILVSQFEKGDDATRKRIYDFYLANTQHVNNWDLVDLSAPQIVGGHLENRSRKPLYRLADFYQQVFGCTPVPPERHLAGRWIKAATGLLGAEIHGVHLRLPGLLCLKPVAGSWVR